MMAYLLTTASFAYNWHAMPTARLNVCKFAWIINDIYVGALKWQINDTPDAQSLQGSGSFRIEVSNAGSVRTITPDHPLQVLFEVHFSFYAFHCRK